MAEPAWVLILAAAASRVEELFLIMKFAIRAVYLSWESTQRRRKRADKQKARSAQRRCRAASSCSLFDDPRILRALIDEQMLLPSFVALVDLRVAERAGGHAGRGRVAVAPLSVRCERRREHGLPAPRALLISSMHLALVEEVLRQRRDLDHLLALLARDEDRTLRPVVQVELVLAALREGRILQTAKLTFTASTHTNTTQSGGNVRTGGSSSDFCAVASNSHVHLSGSAIRIPTR